VKIIKGKKPVIPRLLIWGEPGVGKSTFASKFPKPVFLQAESRTNHLDIHRVELSSWTECLMAMSEIVSSEYKTCVIDTLGSLEQLLLRHIEKEAGVADYMNIGGGFYKFRSPMMTEWRKFIKAANKIIDKGKNFIILSHCTVKQITLPGVEPFDKFVLATADNKTSDFILSKMDLVGEAHFHLTVKKNSANKNVGVSSGSRKLNFKLTPGNVNKQGVPISNSKVPLDYESYKAILNPA